MNLKFWGGNQKLFNFSVSPKFH